MKLRGKLILGFVLGAFAILIVLCFATYKVTYSTNVVDLDKSLKQRFHLTPEQRKEKEELALHKGDGAAAIALADYHSACEFNENERIKWLLVAAKLKHPDAALWFKAEQSASRLSADSVEGCKLRALEEKDGDTALLLAKHFLFAVGDRAEGEKWVRVAVKQGQPIAQHYLDFFDTATRNNLTGNYPRPRR